MKTLTPILLLFFTALLGYQCGNVASSSVQGTVIRGNIQNAAGLQAFFDKMLVNKANQVLDKADIGNDGQFELSFPEGLEPGMYRLRIGAKKINLVFDQNESLVKVDGDLNTIQSFDYQVEGSPSSQQYTEFMKGLVTQSINPNEIGGYVAQDGTSPMLGLAISYQILGRNAQFLNVLKTAQTKMSEAYPTSEYSNDFATFVAQTEATVAQQMASERIAVGQEAPDIRLPNPQGKEMALSELRGKVVLLDFWASWCGPCRRENPNVVRVYNKYKDRGFTVFSVSLDGLDSRTKARFSSEEQAQQQLESSRDRWVKAIEQDGLPWQYHVSDLKKWECAPAQEYGVRSIPRTFLIDRDGKIAAINLRGAEALEQELLKLL
ncbi:MAG: AhpC/TSA family protein [Saprospiraceae bacterium]|nr:AhpC/TSA family protein [Saprospiraceae bacterium]